MALRETTQIAAQNKGARVNKFVVGFAVTTAFALAGVTTSVAGATNGNSGQNGDVPQSKQDCRNGGYRDYGFRNQGQCIKAVNAQNNGNGYGGNSGQNNNVDLGFSIDGDNNYVSIVFNLLFG